MNTGALKTFAQAARNLLIDQVTSKLDLVLADGRRSIPRNPIHTLKTTTTEYHDEAQHA